MFSHEGRVYRQVNTCFAASFDKLLESGLYRALIGKGYLVEHEDVTDSTVPRAEDCYRVLAPELADWLIIEFVPKADNVAGSDRTRYLMKSLVSRETGEKIRN